MKIYTKTGDDGLTSLLGGKRVKKSCIEMEAIGEVDELNGSIGVLISQLSSNDAETIQQLRRAQNILFNVGSNLAAAQTDLVKVPEVTNERVHELEMWIDTMESSLPPLTQFILPGGTPAAAQSFLARAICRRAERQVVAFGEKVTLNPNLQKYLNRLSDGLFVLGRFLNKTDGQVEIFWEK